MTLLTVCKALAKNVGMTVPEVVVSSPYREWTEAIQFANEAGKELVRRVDWPELRASTALTGDGTNQTFTLPSDYDHLAPAGAVVGGTTILRPLTQSEWQALTAVEGAPRYYLLEGNQIVLWPYLASAETVTVNYQSKNFCSAGATFDADANTITVDEDLFTKALIVRWRRQKGMEYADFEAEYEAALADVARFSDGARF